MSRDGLGRRWSAAWLLSMFLALSTAVCLITISFTQVTEEAAAKRSLGRSIAILGEVDAFLDDNLEDLRLEAESSEGGTVELTGFPVVVTITSDELLTLDREELRSLILARSAEAYYEEGGGAFGRTDDASLAISLEVAIERAMEFLRSSRHDALVLVATAVSVLTCVLALALLLISPLHRGLMRVGLSGAAGTLPVLLISLAVWALLRTGGTGTDDYLTHEILELARDISWVPIRNGLVFLVAGGAFFALGATLTPRQGPADRLGEGQGVEA